MIHPLVTDARHMAKVEIAAMSDDTLAHLSYDMMVDLVLASELHVPQIEHIRQFEGDAICRLVRAARAHCRETAKNSVG